MSCGCCRCRHTKAGLCAAGTTLDDAKDGAPDLKTSICVLQSLTIPRVLATKRDPPHPATEPWSLELVRPEPGHRATRLSLGFAKISNALLAPLLLLRGLAWPGTCYRVPQWLSSMTVLPLRRNLANQHPQHQHEHRSHPFPPKSLLVWATVQPLKPLLRHGWWLRAWIRLAHRDDGAPCCLGCNHGGAAPQRQRSAIGATVQRACVCGVGWGGCSVPAGAAWPLSPRCPRCRCPGRYQALAAYIGKRLVNRPRSERTCPHCAARGSPAPVETHYTCHTCFGAH